MMYQKGMLSTNRIYSGYWHLASLIVVSLVLLYPLYDSSSSSDRSLIRTEPGQAEGTVTNVISKNSPFLRSPAPSDEFLLKPPSKDKTNAAESALNKNDFIEEPYVDLSSSSSPLEITWLMSFPNSGTTYTANMIRRVSLTHTATNYGHENLDVSVESVPVYQDQPTGPFWVDPLVHPEYATPPKYVLTKTHCGMRCIPCVPQTYVETTFSFRRRCLSGKRLRATNNNLTNSSNNNSDGITEKEEEQARKGIVYDEVEYPDHRISKAVHLIRDPFDNIVSRFHMERHEDKTAINYPKTRDGFRLFCERLNGADKLGDDEAQRRPPKFLEDNVVLALLRDVPCRSDLIRFIEWHNLAFATSQDMELETYVLHYYWYKTRFNETVLELLDFLQLEAHAESEPFLEGKEYRHYFTERERSSVRLAFQRLASKTTWKHIEGYFVS